MFVKQFNPNEAINCLLKAIELNIELGYDRKAATFHETIAKIYENEVNDMVKFRLNVKHQ